MTEPLTNNNEMHILTCMSKILESLRRTLESTDESRYSIARGSGVDASQLCRFVSGERGISIEAAETLADYLGLEIIIRPKRSRRKA